MNLFKARCAIFNLNREVWNYFPALIIFLLSALFLLMDSDTNNLLRFDRELIQQGEYWRILSCNFIHTNWFHLLMNCIGFFVVSVIFKDYVKPLWMHFFCLGALILNTLLLFFWSPELYYYVGFSGALHGILFALSIASIRKEPLLAYAILFSFSLKILLEQTNGAPDSISKLIEANVAIDAHLWGALSGVLLGMGYLLYQKGRVSFKKKKKKDLFLSR